MCTLRPRWFTGVLALSIAAACSGAARPAPGAGVQAPGVEPVRTEILARSDNPPGAAGKRLTLVRYTIAPGVLLPPHTHPGIQVASVQSGLLTYRVVSGTATVRRGIQGNGEPLRTESLVGPAETVIEPGDAVVETAEMVHVGENRTGEPIVILSTLLTDLGKELAIPVP